MKNELLLSCKSGIVWAILLLFLVGCSRSGYMEAAYPSRAETAASSMADYADSDKTAAPELAEENRKMVYSGNMRIDVRKLEDQSKQAAALVKEKGGYVLSISDTHLKARLPAALLETTMDELAALGKVKNQRIYGRDITDQYTDVQLRLSNAETSQQRYLELLKEADKVSDILLIEKELERLNVTIEQYKGYLNKADEEVAYSLLDISFKKEVRPGPLGYVFKGIWQGVKWLFVWD